MKPKTYEPGTVGELRLWLTERAEQIGTNEIDLVPVMETYQTLDPWGDSDPAERVPAEIVRRVRRELLPKPVHKQTAEEFQAKMDAVHGKL